MGRAIVRNPKVFLMDEPLSNLDAKLRVQMRIEISKLHQRLQTTFIYVTHDQTEAMTLGTRIIVMKDGIVQQVDTPQNLYDRPVNLFVAGFMGSPQMNFIKSKVVKEGNEISLHFFIFSKPRKYATFLGQIWLVSFLLKITVHNFTKAFCILLVTFSLLLKDMNNAAFISRSSMSDNT